MKATLSCADLVLCDHSCVITYGDRQVKRFTALFEERRPKVANKEGRYSYRLTMKDAIEVWIRHWRGEFQHHIAAHFGVNPGRVNEVLKGRRLPGSEQAARSERGSI